MERDEVYHIHSAVMEKDRSSRGMYVSAMKLVLSCSLTFPVRLS